MNETNTEVERLRSLQNVRKYVVYAALALLLISLVQRMPIVTGARIALWAVAGVLSVLEGMALKKLAQPATNAWMNAAIYFAVSVFPLLARH